jgi:hypothetical protein
MKESKGYTHKVRIKEICMSLKTDINSHTVTQELKGLVGSRGRELKKFPPVNTIGDILRKCDYLVEDGVYKVKSYRGNYSIKNYKLKPKPLYDENMLPITKVQNDNRTDSSRCVGGIDDLSDTDLLISKECKIKELNEELAWIEIHKMVEDSKELD